MTDRLANRVAVITGAASGIGRRTAELFASEGASVVLADLNETLLAEVRDGIGEEKSATACVDVSREEDVERLMQLALERFGRLDVAVNSAGIGTFSSVLEHAAESWRRVLDVSLTGTFLCVKHAARTMREQGNGGAIINLASISGRQPAEGQSAYCAAKAGVQMLTSVSALELGPLGIRVNAIAPGFVETPMTAPIRDAGREAYLGAISLGRPGQPDDIARAALFLASDESSWVTGETLVVDGGGIHREAPRMLSKGN